MNDISYERGILRGQLKSDLVDYIRARRNVDDRLSIADVLIRTCRLKAWRV